MHLIYEKFKSNIQSTITNKSKRKKKKKFSPKAVQISQKVEEFMNEVNELKM